MLTCWVPIQFPKILIKSIFFPTNGPHNQYVLIDTSRTFSFRQGLPGKCLGKRPIFNPLIRRASAWDEGLDLGPFLKTFPWKSLTKNKGKAHIYPDVLIMGSIYKGKSLFSKTSWNFVYAIIPAYLAVCQMPPGGLPDVSRRLQMQTAK